LVRLAWFLVCVRQICSVFLHAIFGGIRWQGVSMCEEAGGSFSIGRRHGLGTLQTSIALRDSLRGKVVNHSHNDYLELLRNGLLAASSVHRSWLSGCSNASAVQRFLLSQSPCSLPLSLLCRISRSGLSLQFHIPVTPCSFFHGHLPPLRLAGGNPIFRGPRSRNHGITD